MTVSSTGSAKPQSGALRILAVVVNYNGGVETAKCVESVLAQDVPVTCVVVDNASEDGSPAELRRAFGSSVSIVDSPSNVGYGAAADSVARVAEWDVLVVMNFDVVLDPSCLGALAEAVRARPGISGPVLQVEATGGFDQGLTINHLGVPTALDPGDSSSPLFVTGCVMAMSRPVYEAVEGFDERYFLFVEDAEICWRALLAGFDVFVTHDARAVHLGGRSIIGGYPGEAGTPYVTNDRRVYLRERNTIAMMIACAPWWWWPIVIPALVARCVLLAGAATVLGRPRLALALLAALSWNGRELGRSLQRRRTVRPSAGARARATKRIIYAPLTLRTLRRHGLPRFA